MKEDSLNHVGDYVTAKDMSKVLPCTDKNNML